MIRRWLRTSAAQERTLFFDGLIHKIEYRYTLRLNREIAGQKSTTVERELFLQLRRPLRKSTSSPVEVPVR